MRQDRLQEYSQPTRLSVRSCPIGIQNTRYRVDSPNTGTYADSDDIWLL